MSTPSTYNYDSKHTHENYSVTPDQKFIGIVSKIFLSFSNTMSENMQELFQSNILNIHCHNIEENI